LRAPDRPLTFCDREHLDPVIGEAPGPIGQHLPRASPIELLGVGEERDGDPAGALPTLIRPRADVRRGGHGRALAVAISSFFHPGRESPHTTWKPPEPLASIPW